MSRDVAIREFLAVEGFETGHAAERARAALERAGLTRPGKLRISEDKLPAARAVIGSAFLRVCEKEECARVAEGSGQAGRERVTVSAARCEVCGGSNTRRAAAALSRTLSAEGIERILVVGGTPAQHAEIHALVRGEGLQVRCVDGARGSHSRRDAAPNLDWAQVMVVWGATPLPHKVSKLYTDDPPPRLRVVPLAKRGVEALCREVIRSFTREVP